MASHDVEVFANTIRDNASVNAAVVSFLVTGGEIQNERYDPYPSRVFVHDNTFGGGGDAPDVSKRLGAVLAAGMSVYPNNLVPSIIYDGILDPAKGGGPNPHALCIRANGTATFGDLHLDKLAPNLSNLAAIATFDPAPYDCALPPVTAETFEP